MISAVKLFAAVFAVVLLAGADKPEFFGKKQPAFGPKIGERLPYVLPVDQLPKSDYARLSVSSTLEGSNSIISFVKELDQATLDLMRRLDRAQPQLKQQYRGLRLIVVWVGGEKQKLARWATKHKLAQVTLGVIEPDAKNLHLWRIPRKAVSTTVFVRYPRTPVASFLNLTPVKFDELADRIADDFRFIKR